MHGVCTKMNNYLSEGFSGFKTQQEETETEAELRLYL